MLYLGCFNFDSVQDGERLTGGFEIVVEATTPVAAVKAFRRHIEEVSKTNGAFGGEMRVYLGGIIEVRRPPRGGVLVNWRSQRTPDAHSMIGCLTPVESRSVACYYWRDDAAGTPGDDADMPMQPFMVLNRRRGSTLLPPKLPTTKSRRRR